MEQMLQEQEQETVFTEAKVTAAHLVGNMYYQLDTVAGISAQLDPYQFRLIADPQAGILYSTMCRLLTRDRKSVV